MSITTIITDVSNTILGHKTTAKLKYFHQRGRWPNLNKPSNLAEYLLAQRFQPTFDRYAPYADKVLVRDYVTNCGLAHTLLRHYGVWDKPEDINFDDLPNEFILKVNNGCGGHVICRDKAKINIQSTIQTLNRGIKNGSRSDERHYRAIKPKVFCEELIKTDDNTLPTDYKILCINGKPDHILVVTGRGHHLSKYILNFNWEHLPYYRIHIPDDLPPKPSQLNNMIKYAKILAHGFDCVRVDFYEVDNKIYFGELTFSPAGGYLHSYTTDALEILGQKLMNK